jgi:hypothetical protein
MDSARIKAALLAALPEIPHGEATGKIELLLELLDSGRLSEADGMLPAFREASGPRYLELLDAARCWASVSPGPGSKDTALVLIPMIGPLEEMERLSADGLLYEEAGKALLRSWPSQEIPRMGLASLAIAPSDIVLSTPGFVRAAAAAGIEVAALERHLRGTDLSDPWDNDCLDAPGLDVVRYVAATVAYRASSKGRDPWLALGRLGEVEPPMALGWRRIGRSRTMAGFATADIANAVAQGLAGTIRSWLHGGSSVRSIRMKREGGRTALHALRTDGSLIGTLRIADIMLTGRPEKAADWVTRNAGYRITG